MTFGILTLGCRVNHYESRVIKEDLEEMGLTSQPFSSKCDIYVINSCAVTEESVRKTRQMVRRAYKSNPDAFIAVCGCASQLEGTSFSDMKEISFVGGTRNKQIVINAIRSFINNEPYPKALVPNPEGELTPTLITDFDRTRAYVKIEDGCEGKCAYCIIPKVRGGIVLRDENEILCEVKALAKSGCHEVVLTGIETSAYGKALSELIKKISQIDGINRIRLGSLDPSFIKPEFVDAISDIKEVCHHFHISIQNGSDRILALMRRRYNTSMIRRNLEYLKSKMPDLNLSADVIVGFPGESEEDFEKTCNFVSDIGFLHLHIFTYSKRPGTEAAEMKDQIPEHIKTERLHRLSAIADEEKERILNSVIEEGKSINVLVETFENGYHTGHTDNFIECMIKNESDKEAINKGDIVSVIPCGILDGKLLCKI